MNSAVTNAGNSEQEVIQELLKKWNFADYVCSVFKDAEVDLETLLSLDIDGINILFPSEQKTGFKLKLLNKIKVLTVNTVGSPPQDVSNMDIVIETLHENGSDNAITSSAQASKELHDKPANEMVGGRKIQSVADAEVNERLINEILGLSDSDNSEKDKDYIVSEDEESDSDNEPLFSLMGRGRKVSKEKNESTAQSQSKPSHVELSGQKKRKYTDTSNEATGSKKRGLETN